ncbi:MAG: M56 family metallopeptidase [Candidatus Sulfotelmatobacter sp.]
MAEIFAGRMLNSVLEGTVLALFGWILVNAFRRQNSSTRFAVWFACLAGIALLPFFDGTSGAATFLSATHTAFRLPGSWAVDIFMAWAVIAGAGLGKIGFGFWQLQKLRRSCTVIDTAGLDPVLGRTLNEFGLSRRVAVYSSDRVRVPTAIGFLRPAIVFPSWALQELSALELNAILLHELAHLRRRDDWTNLAQEILRALLFFQPALGLVGRGLSLQREMACDDFVLESTSNPRAYAQCLVSVAEKSLLRRSLALAQAVAGRMLDTTRRVVRILDAERPTATKLQIPTLGLVAAFSLVSLIVLPRAPKLIAFGGNEDFSTAVSASVTRVGTEAGMGAKIIPAALHVPEADAARKSNVWVPPVSSAPRLRKLRSYHGTTIKSANAKLVAGNNSPQSVSPHAINLNFTDSADEASYPNAIVLVFHTEEVDDSGRVWSVSVMQLTIFHPAVRQLQKEIIPKTT